MPTWPLSIVLPVRNGADFLAEALDSVLAQDCGDWVLHISDNASNDATPDILSAYAARDSRIRPSRSAEPLSQVANMNRAVGLAETPWLRMLCHDDLLRPDCVRQTLSGIAAVDGSRVALLGNDERHLYANGVLSAAEADRTGSVIPGRSVGAANLFGRGARVSLPSVTTATIRRDAFDALGGFDPRYTHFDIFAWYRLLLHWDYFWLPAQLTVNRIHGRQVFADARASLRSVDDYRDFVAEFTAESGRLLGLTRRERLHAKLVPPGVAATTLASELIAGRWNRVRRALWALPAVWLPFLAPLTVRAVMKERQRLRSLRNLVPADLIYP